MFRQLQKQGPGGGRGQGGGMGGGGWGRGRGGGFGGGPGGFCVCPACGYREPHQQGVPCFEKKCPHCGAVMTRER
ncbi:MAG: hypothetical protein ACUVXF_11980 [Desulfobaccales bacterium]